jgi:glycine/D-amino acid oxidase-like deaminating enzyme
MAGAGQSYDVAVIGGGLVGAATAYGLVKIGAKIALIDEGDVALRASRGNFGLVWVQGKGWNFPPYARWSRDSADLWPDFAAELKDTCGIDVAHSRPGGLEIALDEEELEGLANEMAALKRNLQGDFDYELLDNRALRDRIPEISPDVPGGIYCPHDGHANPLFLLRALHQALIDRGAHYLPDGPVLDIVREGPSYRISVAQGALQAERVLLAAGLGNTTLGPLVGMEIPLHPNRGQILITERVRKFLHYPTIPLRQTAEGTLQIGNSHEDVGLDDGTLLGEMKRIAGRAVRAFPILRNLRIVRAWGALRIMTPDGAPIYQESKSHPGAFAIACHSGVTLAALHARRLAPWILDEGEKPDLAPFTLDRFNAQDAAP